MEPTRLRQQCHPTGGSSHTLRDAGSGPSSKPFIVRCQRGQNWTSRRSGSDREVLTFYPGWAAGRTNSKLMGSNNKFGWLQTPATTLQGKSLYPNLSQYAANRAQTVQSEPNGVFSCQQLTSEPERNHPVAKPFWGLKPPTGVRIPPSPPLLKSSVNMRRFAPCYYFFRRELYLPISF